MKTQFAAIFSLAGALLISPCAFGKELKDYSPGEQKQAVQDIVDRLYTGYKEPFSKIMVTLGRDPDHVWDGAGQSEKKPSDGTGSEPKKDGGKGGTSKPKIEAQSLQDKKNFVKFCAEHIMKISTDLDPSTLPWMNKVIYHFTSKPSDGGKSTIYSNTKNALQMKEYKKMDKTDKTGTNIKDVVEVTFPDGAKFEIDREGMITTIVEEPSHPDTSWLSTNYEPDDSSTNPDDEDESSDTTW